MTALTRPAGIPVRVYVLVLLVLGLLLGLVAGLVFRFTLGPLIGWVLAALVFEVRIWSSIGRMDAARTAATAQRDDPTNGVTDVLLLFVNLISLVVIGSVVLAAHDAEQTAQLVTALLALISAGVSWVLVQTLFTLRYAAMYYDDPVGGVDFNGSGPPTYVDFAYLSFTMGMTYQVSDTNLQTSAFRALVLRHALTAYVFGTVILATTINLVVSVSGG